MSTSHIETSIGSLAPATVIAALHNHELMIKTLCPALVSYAFDSGDASSSATYMVTDKKPIGQVSLLPHAPLPPISPRSSSRIGLGLTDHASRQPTS